MSTNNVGGKKSGRGKSAVERMAETNGHVEPTSAQQVQEPQKPVTKPTPTVQTQEPQETAPQKYGRKTTCPITREQFTKAARGVAVTLGDQHATAIPKEFSTGSLGWFVNAKVTIEVDGVPCQVQVGLNMTIIGSKELPA